MVEETLLILQKIYVTFSSNWVFPYQGGCSQFLISCRMFDSFICSWTGITFHRIYEFSSRRDCNNTADVPSFTLRTALSAIPLVSDLWCRRTMIPGKIFTGFAKFQGIISVNDFRFPIWFQELLQASLCFL